MKRAGRAIFDGAHRPLGGNSQQTSVQLTRTLATIAALITENMYFAEEEGLNNTHRRNDLGKSNESWNGSYLGNETRIFVPLPRPDVDRVELSRNGHRRVLHLPWYSVMSP